MQVVPDIKICKNSISQNLAQREIYSRKLLRRVRSEDALRKVLIINLNNFDFFQNASDADFQSP